MIFSKIGIKQFTLLESKLQMKAGTFHSRINALISRMQEEKETVLVTIEAQFPKVKIFRRISELIDRRIKGLRQQGVGQ